MSVTSPAFGQELKQASTVLAAKISESQRKRVAVVDITDLCGNVSRFGRYLAEELSGELVGGANGFRVMDRAHLQAILQEHKLATTGLIDPETARKLGQFAGVDTLVTGTITSAFGDSVRVMLKALDVSTAEIITQSTADVPKTDAIKNLLGSDTERGCDGLPVKIISDPVPQPVAREAGVGATGNPPGSSTGQTSSDFRRPTFETESYRVSVDSVRKSSRNLTLTLTFQNISEKKIPLSWGMFYDFAHPTEQGPYLLDDNGDKWILVSRDDAQIVWQPGYSAVDVPPGTRLRTKLVFSGPGTGKSFTLVTREGAPQAGRDVVIKGLTTD